MAIKTIPEISVSGFNYPVYNLQYNNNGVDGPSEFTIQFIDEDGKYDRPALSVQTVNIISIDGFNSFPVHPISWTIEESANGKIMTVKFVDTSIILDKINVGLYKRHGLSSSGFLVIVGKEVDPCEDIPFVTDPCNPCSEADFEERRVECAEQRALQVLDIEYSFQDLLSAMPVARVNTPNTNNNYKARYTGTLREVLQSWCSDYGYTFYWDNGLVFVDLRNGITIDDAGIPEDCLLSKSETRTLEGTASQSIISNFMLDGEEREYDCSGQRAQKLITLPLRLDDIIPSRGGIMNYYENYDRLEAMCVMAKYSADLRDNYVWFLKEGINNAQNAESKAGEVIRLMGNLTIREVYSDDNDNSDLYRILLSRAIGSTEQIEAFQEAGGYFFVGKRNNELMTKYLDMEAGLGNGFIGQYWVRKFGGGVNDPANISFLSADGDSVNYYTRYNSPAQFPFLDVLPESTTRADTYMRSLTDIEGGNGTNFILVKRNASFVPAPGSEEVATVAEDMSKYSVKELGASNFQDILREDESLFIAFEKPNGFDITSFSQTNHPIEGANVNITTEFAGYVTHHGLRSAKCHAFTVKTQSAGRIAFYLPPLSSTNDRRTKSTGYVVLVSKNSGGSNTVRVSKKEFIRRNLFDGNTMLNQINYRDATSDIVSLLRANNEEQCFYQDGPIGAILNSLMVGMAYGDQPPGISREYTICGLPTRKYTIRGGLEQFDIQVGDSGLTTRLSFGTRQKVAIGRELANLRFEESRQYYYRKNASYARISSNKQEQTIPFL